MSYTELTTRFYLVQDSIVLDKKLSQKEYAVKTLTWIFFYSEKHRHSQPIAWEKSYCERP